MLVARASRRHGFVLKSGVRAFSGGWPAKNPGNTAFEQGWKAEPPEGFKYDPEKPTHKAFGKLDKNFYAYNTEPPEGITTLDQKRISPEGRTEIRKPQWGWFPRKAEDEGRPDDVAYMIPMRRSGLATEGPYNPAQWVKWGAPWGNQIKAYPEYGNFRWPHAHYEDNNGKLNKWGEDESGFRFLHKRAEERTTPLQKWVQRKLDERFIDLGSKSFTIWLNLTIPIFIAYAIWLFGGLSGHFKAEPVPANPIPVQGYLQRLVDQDIETDPRKK